MVFDQVGPGVKVKMEKSQYNYIYIFICERVKVMENLGLLGNLPASTSSTAATQQQLLSLPQGLQIGHPQVRWLP